MDNTGKGQALLPRIAPVAGPAAARIKIRSRRRRVNAIARNVAYHAGDVGSRAVAVPIRLLAVVPVMESLGFVGLVYLLLR